jgi:hypothetical protein
VSVEEITEILDLIMKRYNGFEMTLQSNP